MQEYNYDRVKLLNRSQLMELIVKTIDQLNERLSADDGYIKRDVEDIQSAAKTLEMLETLKVGKGI